MIVRLFIAGLFGVFALACPGFEDTHSGTYRQFVEDDRLDPNMELEFFRFGDHVQAIVRFYREGSSFQQPLRCVWTRAAQLEADQRFTLTINPTSRQPAATLHGRIESNQSITIRMESQGSTQDLSFERIREQPDRRCNAVEDPVLQFRFSNRLPEGTQEIANPVFAVLWLGVEPVRDGNNVFYVGIHGIAPSIRLQERHRTSDRRGLQDTLGIALVEPPEEIRVASGDTAYSIGHFVVIDDREDDGRIFSWNRSEEPIVAAAIQNIPREDAPPQATGTGKAILYVQDSLDDLDNSVTSRIAGFEEIERREQRYYIVDIDYMDDEILLMTPQEELLLVPVRVSDEFLFRTDISHPRLFPFSGF